MRIFYLNKEEPWLILFLWLFWGFDCNYQATISTCIPTSKSSSLYVEESKIHIIYHLYPIPRPDSGTYNLFFFSW
jgi:hypothetical protein